MADISTLAVPRSVQLYEIVESASLSLGDIKPAVDVNLGSYIAVLMDAHIYYLQPLITMRIYDLSHPSF